MSSPGKVKFTCKVPQCPNKYFSNIKDQSYKNKHFFCLPKNKQVAEQWLKFLNTVDLLKSNSAMRVCEDHFTDNYFTSTLKERLHKGSIPTILLPNPETSEQSFVDISIITQAPANLPCEIPKIQGASILKEINEQCVSGLSPQKKKMYHRFRTERINSCMPIRRNADPISVQHVWDAIKHTELQEQQPADIKRIIKYLQKVDGCTHNQAELHIQQTLDDGLIVPLQELNKKFEETDCFEMPKQELPQLDGKDWYCFECHLGGDVATCKNCFHVFHLDCIASGRKKYEDFKKNNKYQSNSTKNNSIISTSSSILSIDASFNNSSTDLSTYKLNNNVNDDKDSNNKINNEDNYNDAYCSVCNISNIDSNCNLDKSELNYLLKFVILRIQSWLPLNITHTMAEEDRFEWLTDKELSWRANQLFFAHRDMSVIEANLLNETYGKICEFLADVLTIQHNVAIFHGIESQESGAAELMLRDCIHDLNEIKICADCYKHSNEKINARWFCLPCRIPHKLVWAKQKGYPHWPAKVIMETATHYDVRFFGGKYERSLLNKNFVKPIDTPKEKLQIKSSASFNKAVEELKYHQKLLENPDELQKLIDSSKNKVKPLKKLSNVVKKPRHPELVRKSNDLSKDDIYQFEEELKLPQPIAYTPKRKNSAVNETPRKKRSSSSIDKGIEYKSTSSSENNMVIDISDNEEEASNYRTNYSNVDCESSFEHQVSSSTENYCGQSLISNSNQDSGMQQSDQPYCNAVEKMGRRLECMADNKKDLIKYAMDFMQDEIDKLTNEHNEQLKRILDAHNAQISETKKKQWCYNCEQDAIYHCCWNTAYCSLTCQQQHWQAEHKKVCRRKR